MVVDPGWKLTWKVWKNIVERNSVSIQVLVEFQAIAWHTGFSMNEKEHANESTSGQAQ
jgi:hypothetical protein